MNIEEKREGNILVLYLSGQLDNVAAHEFASLLARHIEAGEHHLLLNLANLSYLSSSGLRILLGAAQKLDTLRGKFFLCSLTNAVKQAIELVGFHRILKIYENEDDAFQNF